jgi:hypothetical protein
MTDIRAGDAVGVYHIQQPADDSRPTGPGVPITTLTQMIDEGHL